MEGSSLPPPASEPNARDNELIGVFGDCYLVFRLRKIQISVSSPSMRILLKYIYIYQNSSRIQDISLTMVSGTNRRRCDRGMVAERIGQVIEAYGDRSIFYESRR